MSAKIKEIKTKRPKKMHELSFNEKIAKQVDCSISMVIHVLNGTRSQETPLAQKILLAAAIIEEEESKLLQEVKRIVNFRC